MSLDSFAIKFDRFDLQFIALPTELSKASLLNLRLNEEKGAMGWPFPLGFDPWVLSHEFVCVERNAQIVKWIY